MVKCCSEMDNICVRMADHMFDMISAKARQLPWNVKGAIEDADKPDVPEHEAGCLRSVQ